MLERMFLILLQNSQEKASFLIKKVTLGRCFPVNFAKFLRTVSSIEHYGVLLLTISPIKLENN